MIQRTFFLKKDAFGQWLYILREGERDLMPWQYGPFDRAGVMEQARSRYGNYPFEDEQ